MPQEIDRLWLGKTIVPIVRRIHRGESMRAQQRRKHCEFGLEDAVGNTVLRPSANIAAQPKTAFRGYILRTYTFYELATCSMLYSWENKMGESFLCP